jgi:hypothetical protein
MMALLYDVEVPTINYHLKKVFEDSELEEDAVLRNFRITAVDGKTYDTKQEVPHGPGPSLPERLRPRFGPDQACWYNTSIGEQAEPEQALMIGLTEQPQESGAYRFARRSRQRRRRSWGLANLSSRLRLFWSARSLVNRRFQRPRAPLIVFRTVFSWTPSALPIACSVMPSFLMRRASPAIRSYANGACVNTATSNVTSAAVRIGCSRVHHENS